VCFLSQRNIFVRRDKEDAFNCHRTLTFHAIAFDSSTKEKAVPDTVGQQAISGRKYRDKIFL